MYIPHEINIHNQLIPIDTLAIAKRLQASGMPKEQAETQAEVLGEIVLQNLASKADVEILKNGTEGLRKETSTNIETLRKETEALRKETSVNIETVRKETETLRKETAINIENLRKDLLIEIGHIKYDIMKWIIPLMAGQLIAAAGLMKIFIN